MIGLMAQFLRKIRLSVGLPKAGDPVPVERSKGQCSNKRPGRRLGQGVQFSREDASNDRQNDHDKGQ